MFLGHNDVSKVTESALQRTRECDEGVRVERLGTIGGFDARRIARERGSEAFERAGELLATGLEEVLDNRLLDANHVF